VEILNVENGYTFIRFEQDNNVLEGFIESLYIQTNEQKCNDDDCTDIEDETKFDSKKDSPEKDIENNSDKENNNDDVEGEVSEKNEKTDTKTDTVEKDEEKDEESKNNPNLNREQNDHNVKSLSKAQESLTGYGQKSPTNVYEGRDRDSKVLKSYAMGSNLKYHNYNETWYETSVILNGEYVKGYIHKDDVDSNKPLLTGYGQNSPTNVHAGRYRHSIALWC